jgi:hypothetical protein
MAVSRPIGGGITESFLASGSVDFQPYRGVELSSDLSSQIEDLQYQRDSGEPERRLMLLIGLGLGAAYLVFLAVWIWATRFRQR